jgi:large subunit ribosomal protein L25
MAEAVELKASPRERLGKGGARTLRREGRVPGTVYGGGKAPESVVVDYKELWMQHQTGHFTATIVTLDVDGKKQRVIPKDVQVDPVRDFPIHVDFMRITKDSEVTIEVPVHFVNEEKSPGIKKGGVLNIVRHDIEVRCPAERIPEQFEVDLSGLDIGDSVHVSALSMPKGVKPTIADRDFTISTIVPPTEEVEDDDDAEAGEGDDEGEDKKSED